MKYFGFVILLIGALLISSCAEWFPHSYRFRMIVEVDTPQGVRTGSSVYEVKAVNRTQLIAHNASRSWNTKGQSVMVDLPNGQTLFTLMKTGAHFGDMAGLSMAALYPKFAEQGYDLVDVADKIYDRDDGVLGSAVVQPKRLARVFRDNKYSKEYVSNYPMMVTFDDIKNPKSVKQVDPDDLAASFGEGYAIKRITIELTDDPVTIGIEKKLGKDFFKKRAKYKKKLKEEMGLFDYSRTFSAQISRRDYTTEKP